MYKSLNPSKNLLALMAAMLVLFSTSIALAGVEDGFINMAWRMIKTFLTDNLTPAGQHWALSLLLAAITATWLFSTRLSRAFVAIFGPIGLFFWIGGIVAGMGITGIFKFMWNLAWSFGPFAALIILGLLFYSLQSMVMKAPGYIWSLIVSTKDQTKKLAKEVDEKKKKEPWAWIVIGGITAIGYIIKPSTNQQNSYLPIILSCALFLAYVLCYFLYYRKHGYWPWEKKQKGAETAPDQPEETQPDQAETPGQPPGQQPPTGWPPPPGWPQPPHGWPPQPPPWANPGQVQCPACHQWNSVAPDAPFCECGARLPQAPQAPPGHISGTVSRPVSSRPPKKTSRDL